MEDVLDTAETRTATDLSTAGPGLPAAVLWDMDGTLIDTEPYWIAAEVRLVAEWGGVWTHEDGEAMVGSAMPVATAILRSRGVGLTDAEIRDYLHEHVAAGVAAGPPWQPGARELLDALHTAGVPLALVTSSYRALAEPFARLVGLFDVVVCGDEVDHAKPHPEPYLAAARALGVDPASCVAIEDSRSGIASALASGSRVVGVEVVQAVPPQPGLSRVSSLTQLTLERLARIGAGEVVDLLG